MSDPASAAAPAAGSPAADLASLAAKAFAGAGSSIGAGAAALAGAQAAPGAGSQSAPAAAGGAPAPGDARAQIPAPAGAGAGTPAAGDGAAKAAIPDGKGPATVLSDTPVNAPDLAKTKAEVAAAAKVEEVAPAYVLAPISERLSKEAVADIETFAKAHKMSEAQAKQVLAREDMRIAEAYDRGRAALIADPDLGGANLPQTITTTKAMLQLLSQEDRAFIANNPIANDPRLHRLAKIVMSLIPGEDFSRRATPAPAQQSMTPGQAWLANPKIRA